MGREILRQALDMGMEVTAFARHPKKIGFTHPFLTVVPGKLDDTRAIEKAVAGSDCVLSALGPGPRVKPKDTALSSGIQNIVSVLERNGPDRIIQVSAASIRDPADQKDLLFSLLVFIVRLIFPGAFAELQRMGRAVKASGLNWTLVRVPLLSGKPLTKKIRAGTLGQKFLRMTLARADLAWFMLEEAQKGRYIKRAPGISS